MSLVGDIFSAWPAPRQAMRQQVLRGVRESQTLFYGLLFCLLTFVSQLPLIARKAELAGPDGPPLAALAGSQFVTSVLFAPLFLYGIAALSHVILRLFHGRASWGAARLALFWAALVTVPLILISGILQAMAAEGIARFFQLLTAGFFLWQWGSCLHEVEFGDIALAEGSK